MRQFDKATVVDEELHDLKLRFELLEGDRKAYYETSQWAIRRNKEEINSLRQQNKQLSEAIARIKKSEIEVSSRISLTELEKFDQKICDIQKKYDELQAEARAKEQKLRKQMDLFEDIKREADMVHSNTKDSPQAKEIRMLENRLDKAVIKYNEAQSIRKTYELIVKRLQEERLTFDNQLANFEKTVRAKKQDAAELEMMSRDANHAKEVAKAELAQFEQQINEERKQREKDLQTRKEMVKHKLEVADKADRKITKQDELNADPNGNSDVKEQYDEATEKKLAEYEETMRLIKEATGVSDISEVIAKFQSQGETHAQLTQLQKINEIKIAELKEKKKIVQKENEEFKFMGESKHAHSQRTIEEFESHLKQSEQAYIDAKQKYERTVKILTNAKAGVQHLAEKLDAIKVGSNLVKAPAVTNNTVVEALQVCVKKLESLATSLQNKELPEAPPKDNSQQQQPGEVVNILVVNPTVLPQYNTRVKLKPVDFEGTEQDDEDENDDEFEVPDRESLKKHTLQLINSRLKAKQPKKVKKKKAAKDDDIWIVRVYSQPENFEYTVDIAGFESVFVSPMSIYHNAMSHTTISRNNYSPVEPRRVVVVHEEKEEDLPSYELEDNVPPPTYDVQVHEIATVRDGPLPYESIYPSQ
ncbi:hypothetical protein HK103_004137 [Boothiomyces macroporosus]|uniref:ODAD1 central coiled coil region domain-containing protein n=1 Tax=Boothiomyces macroporosus TaxID=261099 RepID=A0AAD5UHW0_9FUNG|nr:hypothetical protein HK103_004137 [Boothiomyces macroporosus]